MRVRSLKLGTVGFAVAAGALLSACSGQNAAAPANTANATPPTQTSTNQQMHGGTATETKPGKTETKHATQPATAGCKANQFTAKLVGLDAGAGNRYGALQLTGKPGQRCTLPGRLDVGLVGGRDILVANKAPANAPAVTLSDGSSAHVQLHWTAVGGEDEQQTPNGVTVTLPSAPDAPNQVVDWNMGPVDANKGSHTIEVGALTQGVAQAK